MGVSKRLKKYLRSRILRFLRINNENQQPPFLMQSKKFLKVGKNTFHNGNFKIKGANRLVTIGSYCALGEDIKIITSNHNYNYASIQYSFYKKNFEKLPYDNEKQDIENPVVEIGNDVWIGDNVIILCNVKIGNGACIGAGSIITKDVAAYSIVAGIPAKKIRMRFKDDVIKKLEDIKWWNFTDDEIESNKDLFFKNLNDD